MIYLVTFLTLLISCIAAGRLDQRQLASSDDGELNWDKRGGSWLNSLINKGITAYSNAVVKKESCL